MTILGLPESTIATAIRAVTDDGSDPDAAGLADRFARSTWSCITEPGDGVAGLVVHVLGAEPALRALITERAGDAAGATLSTAVREVGLELTPSDLQQGIERWAGRLKSDVALRAVTQAARFGATLVVPGDPAWPIGLGDLGSHRPHALWVRGSTAVLGQGDASIALVGARAATGYGEHVTVEAAGGLVDRGYTIVSGAAYGIDGVAHRAALAGHGDTVAVLAGGVDRFYPTGHESLLTRIVERGAVVSEVSCGSAPTRWRFLQRNRLIAAMSAATVVIEAGWRSGSLNTAGHAAAMGRPLGAVPGPVTSSASAGCHRLLRDYDAVCVTTAAEMAELAPIGDGTDIRIADGRSGVDPDASIDSRVLDAEGARMRVLDALSSRSPRGVDEVASGSGLTPDQVRARLGTLELEGAARRDERGWTKAPQPRGER